MWIFSSAVRRRHKSCQLIWEVGWTLSSWFGHVLLFYDLRPSFIQPDQTEVKETHTHTAHKTQWAIRHEGFVLVFNNWPFFFFFNYYSDIKHSNQNLKWYMILNPPPHPPTPQPEFLTNHVPILAPSSSALLILNPSFCFMSKEPWTVRDSEARSDLHELLSEIEWGQRKRGGEKKKTLMQDLQSELAVDEAGSLKSGPALNSTQTCSFRELKERVNSKMRLYSVV